MDVKTGVNVLGENGNDQWCVKLWNTQQQKWLHTAFWRKIFCGIARQKMLCGNAFWWKMKIAWYGANLWLWLAISWNVLWGPSLCYLISSVIMKFKKNCSMHRDLKSCNAWTSRTKMHAVFEKIFNLIQQDEKNQAIFVVAQTCGPCWQNAYGSFIC